jgi:choline kinase
VLSSVHSRITDAIVLAAGNGDRFQGGSAESKLVTPVGGTPVLLRTLAAAREAGLERAHVVLGYDADRVRACASAVGPGGLQLHFHVNLEWERENGVSVLAARSCLDDRPFALLMGDHLFHPAVLRRLLGHDRGPGESLLAVDRQARDPRLEEEATKVRTEDGLVTAIGKDVAPYDALDTGLFVCDPSVFDALDASCSTGDSSVSGGIRQLAARGCVRGVDIGNRPWCDIDTVADLAHAERLVARAFEA